MANKYKSRNLPWFPLLFWLELKALKHDLICTRNKSSSRYFLFWYSAFLFCIHQKSDPTSYCWIVWYWSCHTVLSLNHHSWSEYFLQRIIRRRLQFIFCCVCEEWNLFFEVSPSAMDENVPMKFSSYYLKKGP